MEPTEDWISLREFARRRGVRLAAVQKAIASGRVTAVRRGAGGRLERIECVQATRQWNENTDPAEAAKSGQVIAPSAAAADLATAAAAGPPAPAPALALAPAAGQERGSGEPPTGSTEKAAPEPSRPAANADRHGYHEARAERERAEAQLASLKLLEQLGVLVDAEEVRQASMRRYRALRDQLLNIPDRVSAIVAAEKDPARVHAALTAEIKRVLHERSDAAAAEAGGAEERLAT